MKTTAVLMSLLVLVSTGCQSTSRKRSARPNHPPTGDNLCVENAFLSLKEGKPLLKSEPGTQAWSSVSLCDPTHANVVNFSYEILSPACAGTIIQFDPESGRLNATLNNPQDESCDVKLGFESKGKTMELLSTLRFIDRLTQGDLSISLEQKTDSVNVKIQTNPALPSTIISNPTHPDHGKYLELQKRLNGLDYEVKKFEVNGTVNFTLTSTPASTERLLDSSKPFYAFLESLDRFAADIQPILEKGDTIFSSSPKSKERALYGTTSNEAFTSSLGVFISGPFIYCALPLFNDIKIPSFLQRIIDINCQSLYLQTFNADFPSLRISLAARTYRQFVDARETLGSNFFALPFSGLALSVCPAANVLSTQQSYKEAGWIDEVNVEDTELVTRQCGMFIHKKVLPRLKGVIEQAVSRQDLQMNPTAAAYVEAISRAVSSEGQEVDPNKVNEAIKGLFDAEISALAEHYNKVYDMAPAALNNAMLGREWTRSNFAEAIGLYFASVQNSAQTPFMKKYLGSSEATKKKYRDYLATLLSMDCNVGPEVSTNCVSISRKRLDRYSVRFISTDGNAQIYWSIGGVASGI